MKKQNKQEYLIAFNDKGFKKDTENRARKINLFNELLSGISKFKEVNKTDYKDVRKQPIEFIENAVLEHYQDVNLMKLSYKKLVDVLELENQIKPIIDLANKYLIINLDETKPIDKESYKLYATDQNQKDRLMASRKLIDSLTELKNLNTNLSLPRIAQNLNRTLLINSNGTLDISPGFVLDGLVR